MKAMFQEARSEKVGQDPPYITRGHLSQCLESELSVVAHKVKILFSFAKVFYGASGTPFPRRWVETHPTSLQ